MVFESAKDTIFSIRYDRVSDSFTLERSDQLPTQNIARFSMGDDDFILFNNDRPGTLDSASHKADNKTAIEALVQAVFDHNYPLLCESLREQATIYNKADSTARLTVPYSNKKRLKRITLHTQATSASREVMMLHNQISRSIQQEPTIGGGAYVDLLPLI